MSTSGSGPVNPNQPGNNQTNLYINGQYLTWASTTTFTVGKGMCRDSTDTVDILMGATLFGVNAPVSNNNTVSESVVVTVDNTLSGAGGLDVGAVAASTMYSVFAIGASNGFKNGSAVISTAAPTVGPSLPLGYDVWRYIGSVSTDSSKHFRPFMQTGAQTLRTVWYDPGTGASTQGVTIPSSGTSGSTTFVNLGVLTTLVPQTALEAIYNVALTPNSANNLVFLSAPTIDNGTTATVGAMACLSAAATGSAQVANVRVPVSIPNATQRTALTIGAVVTTLYATTSASDSVVFLLHGYVDQL